MTALLAELPVRPIAVFVVLVLFLIWVTVLLGIGARGRQENIPPNLKPYLTDEELEEKKVVNVGVLGLVTAVALAVIMAGYWLFIPKMQADASAKFVKESVDRGTRLFDTTEKGGLNCAGCHGGGLGGKTDFVLTAGVDKGKKVSWECPPLFDVYYRFTRDEVKNILIYGRPGTPMPAWGLSGGGPLIDQQLEDILNFLKSKEVKPEDAVKNAGLDAQGNKILDGKGLFLKNCARCHTPQFSYTDPDQRASLPQGLGAYGPALTSEKTQFPDVQDQINFISQGSLANKPYGTRGIGNGRMPGFGTLKSADHPLLDNDQINALAEYERSLGGGAATTTPNSVTPTASGSTSAVTGTAASSTTRG
jgi:mono/diheme cytochrome c family protein